jgi:hypothetical protein
MPEKSAVIDTAMFITLMSMPRSVAMVEAMFSVVWAKSQKATTPRIIPMRSRSFPGDEVWELAAGVIGPATPLPAS